MCLTLFRHKSVLLEGVNMASSVVSVPCPSCGASLGSVFDEKCPSCGQVVVVNKCPTCGNHSLLIVKQARQRVAFCQDCDWTKIEQGLGQDREVEGMKCPNCETHNQTGANFCKECGKPLK
ncbi:hypothetical protein AUJ42_00165 [Candidatus Collierbacteria bacterium CG1_02_44_10]|uniref:Zinc-ribbon domain-containing protein n=1 Tax=Candidatus Collierbacteria bacterium CG1_02_44_10 TaxID=1805087 RepID=A0A1J4S254_9BACT|nr:MAG: hypothetical protein AUJ42_00165 [Candidatus Collierbacteria bacterium CG1_02_44_10]